jgi:hypothetical protein
MPAIDWIPISDVQPGDRVKIPRGSTGVSIGEALASDYSERAMAMNDHYFWVKPVSDPCGECFPTLEEAIAEAEMLTELEKVHPVDGPIEVVEVRGSVERPVWRAGKALV